MSAPASIKAFATSVLPNVVAIIRGVEPYSSFWFRSVPASIYWHFVDLVWIIFYPALYLIGKAVL